MHRIFRNAALTVLAVAGLYGLVWLYDAALRDARHLDGWILAAGCLAQLSFSMRRKLPLLPLGRVASWMQAHLYIGYFLIATFALHTQFEWPDGILETALWILFFILTLSGVVGAYLTRTMPSQMPSTGAHTQLEDIYSAQFALAKQADDLALSSGGAASISIAELYANTLHGFFNAQRNALLQLLWPNRSVRRVYAEIDGVDAHVDTGGQKTLSSIRQLVGERDRLDNQYARQLVLKAWLFVHIPATYGMLVLSVVHIAVVYAYSAGAP